MIASTTEKNEEYPKAVDFDLSLPEIDIKKNTGIRLVSRAVSLTFLILVIAASVALVIMFTVSMDLTIDAEGVLEPAFIKHIHSNESGIIKDVFVTSGDTVTAGQKIAVLDSLQLIRNLTEVQFDIKQIRNTLDRETEQSGFDEKENILQLQKAEAQFLKAKAAFRDRLLNFFPKANVDSIYENYLPGSHITLDFAMAEISSAEADIASRKLAIEKRALKKYDIKEMEINFDKLLSQEKTLLEKLNNIVIRSPVEGIVLTEGINELPGKRINEGDLVLDIGETKNWDVVLFVTERDVHQIKLGNDVKVEMNALQSTEDFELYEGSVISVAEERVLANAARYGSFSGLYRVTAKLLSKANSPVNGSKLKYGYNVKGNIITDSGKIYELLLKYFTKLL